MSVDKHNNTLHSHHSFFYLPSFASFNTKQKLLLLLLWMALLYFRRRSYCYVVSKLQVEKKDHTQNHVMHPFNIYQLFLLFPPFSSFSTRKTDYQKTRREAFWSRMKHFCELSKFEFERAVRLVCRSVLTGARLHGWKSCFHSCKITSRQAGARLHAWICRCDKDTCFTPKLFCHVLPRFIMVRQIHDEK